MYNSHRTSKRGNQLVVQYLSCMVFFLCFPFLHAIATHAINFVDAGAFPQRRVGMSVCVEKQDCVPTNDVQEGTPERTTNCAINSPTNFMTCAKHYAHACFRFVGMFAGMFAGTLADPFADPFADKCCADCLQVVCVKEISGRN